MVKEEIGHLPATHLTDLPGGCQRVSSSLKEKWTRDSRRAGGSVRSGGRGLARGAVPERMGAKRCQGEHGDSGTVVWRAVLEGEGPRCLWPPLAPPPHPPSR